jgi:hypothetical protein
MGKRQGPASNTGHGQVPESIGVLEAADKPLPIGGASCPTRDEDRLAFWTLRIGKQELSGRWVLIDHEFRPAQ